MKLYKAALYFISFHFITCISLSHRNQFKRQSIKQYAYYAVVGYIEQLLSVT